MLQGVTEVVRLFEWNIPKIEGDLDAYHIYYDLKLLEISSKSPLKTLNNVKIVMATNTNALQTDGLNCFNLCQYRQIVTKCIKNFFNIFVFISQLIAYVLS